MYSGLSDKVAVVVGVLEGFGSCEGGCGVGWLGLEGEGESRLRGRPAKARGAERADMRGAKVL